MKLTKAGLICLVTIVVLSAFVANIAQMIAIEAVEGETVFNPHQPEHMPIGNLTDNLIWFIQISDLHLSIFHDFDRELEFQEFCDSTLNVLKPSVVLATGDLTDAKEKDNVGSRQFEGEWKKYGQVLNTCTSLKNIPWLDIRGNHDNFDVPGVESNQNYFRKYSAQGKTHFKSYIHNVKKGNRLYSFIGVDACPNQGLKRPFNFVGLLQDNDLQELRWLAKEANNSDSVIWFGHYPTSCILSHPPGIRHLIGSVKGSLAYMCGHFHTLLGFVPSMYTIQKHGFYELELADWKDNRMFRFAAIDHGLLSFVDVKHNDWPIILITNPKDIRFQLFSKEPLSSVLTSTYIRLLVFSPSKILSVSAKVDDNAWENCIQSQNKNLYLLKWDANQFYGGIHYIHVSVLDQSGRQKMIKQQFSLDHTTSGFSLPARLILMLNFSATLQILFGLSTICSVLPLCILRYMNKTLPDKDLKNPIFTLKNGIMKRWLRRFWILSNTDRLFFPIVLYPLYMAIGPWAVGELIDGYTGVIFIWGIFVNGAYIPGSFTYGYGFIQLFLFQGPLTVFSAYTMDDRLFGKRVVRRNQFIKYTLFFLHCVPFLLIFISQVTMTYTFWLAYGTMSVLLGPIRLWPIALTLWAWFNANSMPLSKIKGAAAAWIKNVEGTYSSSQSSASVS